MERWLSESTHETPVLPTPINENSRTNDGYRENRQKQQVFLGSKYPLAPHETRVILTPTQKGKDVSSWGSPVIGLTSATVALFPASRFGKAGSNPPTNVTGECREVERNDRWCADALRLCGALRPVAQVIRPDTDEAFALRGQGESPALWHGACHRSPHRQWGTQFHQTLPSIRQKRTKTIKRERSLSPDLHHPTTLSD